MLDAGVVDEEVDRPEFGERLLHHARNGFRAAHIRAVVDDAHAVLCRQLSAQPLDLGGVAEAVEHDVGASRREPRDDA